MNQKRLMDLREIAESKFKTKGLVLSIEIINSQLNVIVGLHKGQWKIGLGPSDGSSFREINDSEIENLFKNFGKVRLAQKGGEIPGYDSFHDFEEDMSKSNNAG